MNKQLRLYYYAELNNIYLNEYESEKHHGHVTKCFSLKFDLGAELIIVLPNYHNNTENLEYVLAIEPRSLFTMSDTMGIFTKLVQTNLTGFHFYAKNYYIYIYKPDTRRGYTLFAKQIFITPADICSKFGCLNVWFVCLPTNSEKTIKSYSNSLFFSVLKDYAHTVSQGTLRIWKLRTQKHADPEQFLLGSHEELFWMGNEPNGYSLFHFDAKDVK